MSTTTQCPVCHSPVIEHEHLGVSRYEPAPLTPATLVVALDNEQVARAVGRVATPELRLALASVMLEGQPGGGDQFFTAQDVRDEAEASARCEGVAAQMRKQGTQFTEAAEFRELAARHRKRAMRIMALLPDDQQQKMKAEMNRGPAAPVSLVQ